MSVPVTGTISTTDPGTDTYAVIDPIEGVDGWRCVPDKTARNAITTLRRRVGMPVYCQDDPLGTFYQLNTATNTGTNADWTSFTIGSGGGSLPSGTAGQILIHDDATPAFSSIIEVYSATSPNATGVGSFVQVGGTASGDGACALNQSIASGDSSHAEGTSRASDFCAHAEGESTVASGEASHAEGGFTAADHYTAHAEGDSTTASEHAAHAEGYSTTASGPYSHAEGHSSQATGERSHAEGDGCIAGGYGSHAEGSFSQANGQYSHAENGGIATGDNSHAEGTGTATGAYSHAGGQNSVADLQSKIAYSDGAFTATTGNKGDGQFSMLPCSATTDHAVTTRNLTIVGGSGSTTVLLLVRANFTYAFTLHIAARQRDGSAMAYFIRQGVIHNEAGTTSLEGAIHTIGTDINAPGWTVAITADDVNDALQVAVTADPGAGAGAKVFLQARLDCIEIGS